MEENAEAVATGGLSEGFRADNPVVWGLLVASLMANDPASYAESALATAEGTMERLGELTCPVLAFAGSEDAATPPDAGAEVAEAAPQGESAVIDGAAHWCQLEAPGEVNRLLTAFFGTHRPS